MEKANEKRIAAVLTAYAVAVGMGQRGRPGRHCGGGGIWRVKNQVS